MSRRVSAGELELRYKVKHQLYDFFDQMKSNMFRNIPEKGDSWKKSSNQYLIKCLKEHLEASDWVSVANFAFMLNDKREEEKP